MIRSCVMSGWLLQRVNWLALLVTRSLLSTTLKWWRRTLGEPLSSFRHSGQPIRGIGNFVRCGIASGGPFVWIVQTKQDLFDNRGNVRLTPRDPRCQRPTRDLGETW